MKRNTVLIICCFVLLLSCNKKDNFLNYIIKEKKEIKKNTLNLFLPNESCSFCVNRILEFLDTNKKTKKLNIFFLESNMTTFIDKNLLKKLDSRIRIIKDSINTVKKYDFLIKENNHFIPLAIEYIDDDNVLYHKIPISVNYDKLFNLINTYYNNEI